MKKTKITFIYLILVFIVSLNACGPKKAGDEGKEPIVTDVPDAQSQKPDDNTTDENAESSEEEAQNNDETSAKVIIDEQILYEGEGIKITAVSFDEKEFLGPELELLIENSSAKNVTVQTREVSVNDLMLDAVLSCDVVAGKKAKDSIVFFSSDLERNGIDKIAAMELGFVIFATDTFDEITETESFTINTSAKESYVQTYDDSGDEIFESNDIRIIDKGIGSNEIFGKEIKLYIENNSPQSITVQADKVSVNGFMVDPIFSSDVSPRKKRNDSITFLDLEENGIDEITEVELSFKIFNMETLDVIAESETISLKYD